MRKIDTEKKVNQEDIKKKTSGKRKEEWHKTFSSIAFHALQKGIHNSMK